MVSSISHAKVNQTFLVSLVMPHPNPSMEVSFSGDISNVFIRKTIFISSGKPVYKMEKPCRADVAIG